MRDEAPLMAITRRLPAPIAIVPIWTTPRPRAPVAAMVRHPVAARTPAIAIPIAAADSASLLDRADILRCCRHLGRARQRHGPGLPCRQRQRQRDRTCSKRE